MRPAVRPQRGAALIALVALLALGGLYWFVSNLATEDAQTARLRKTDTALNTARDALLGYALRYRETLAASDNNSSGEDDRAIYGYLPLPDLGSSRNNNAGCSGEGCDAQYANFSYDGNGMPPTLIGRFPWKALGTGVLRDGDNECLWLVVSSSHGRIQRSTPPATPPAMNWDTQGQLEIVTATDAERLKSLLSNKYERPMAVVFAAGPALGSQDRSRSAQDEVSQCGGNYDVANYLESLPALLDAGLASERRADTNLFAGSLNNASGDTSPDPANANPALRDKAKPLSVTGDISRRGNGKHVAGLCEGCSQVANDLGLGLTSSQFFDKLRGGLGFRNDINAMLDRMSDCLRDQIAAGAAFAPTAIAGYTAPADKIAGRIAASTCYDSNQHPQGYFDNYKEQIFVAKPQSGSFTVTDAVSNTTANCAGVLLFANQRGNKSPSPSDGGESAVQLRDASAVSASNATTNDNWLANYLEDANLAALSASGGSFRGATLFDRPAVQASNQDITRCIPAGATFASDVISTPLNTYGGQLTSYSPGTRTVTLGRLFSLTTAQRNALAPAMYGCTWLSDAPLLANGLRVYFKFRIADAGEGFTFAIVDGDRNATNACGAARQHLGYSGNNGATPIVALPKIGIEIDTTRQATFNPSAANPLSNGRGDPSYAGGHVGIVYWGNESAVATTITQTNCTNTAQAASERFWSNGVCYLKAEEDDNVHGRPVPPDASPRPAPRNPPAPAVVTQGAGVYKLDAGLSAVPINQDIHVRIELTRSASNSSVRSKTYNLQIWLLRDSPVDANIIAAMQNTTRAMSLLYPGYAAHLIDNPVIYDIQGAACGTGGACAAGQSCGTDNMCYTEAFRTARLGFTTAQSTTANDQIITISDFFASWLP